MKIHKYKNGNINVTRESGDDMDLVCALCNSAELDFNISEDGEEICVGNDCVATELYNCFTARYYLVIPTDKDNWRTGFAVKLKGYTKEVEE